MIDNKQEKEKRVQFTVYIPQSTANWIAEKALKDRRKPAAMGAILLEDAQKADGGLF